MKTLKTILLVILMIIVTTGITTAQTPAGNKKIIRAGFDRWAEGKASFFDLLSEDVQWTISGSAPLSKTYTSKKQFISEVIEPLNSRLSKKIKPTVRALYAEGDVVIALMDGQATTTDQKPYNMSYAWIMQMKASKIIKVTAFLDGIKFAEVMQRITVADTSLASKEIRESLPYNRVQQQRFPAFTYQSAADPDLTYLREHYRLDSVAAGGTQTDKVIRLLNWFHNQVPHEDVTPISPLNARHIIENYRSTSTGQGCYPLAVAMNEILLSMGFKSRVVICFSNLYPAPDGGHVVNTVYIEALNKWIYIDPQENAYIKDENGNFLSVAEVRERLINGKPMVLNATANYHGLPSKKEDYLYKFIGEHLYRMICPLNSAYNTETRHGLHTYVELLPFGGREPAPSMYETGVYKDFSVVGYHTANDQLFWQRP